jgi:glutaredoxin-related protein
MGWNLSDENLRITYTDTACDADWQTDPSLTIAAAFVTGQDVIPAMIPATAVGASDYSPDSVGSPTFPSCGFSAAYATAIPGGKIPEAPGTPYTFAGPSLTSTLVLEP